MADTIMAKLKKTDPGRHQKELKAVLAASDASLWAAVDSYHKEEAAGGTDDLFPPGPAIIWSDHS